MPTIETRRQTRSGRYYEIDGHLYPSVTTILGAVPKPALIQWAAREERTLVIECATQLYRDALQLTTPLTPLSFTASLQSRLGSAKAHQQQTRRALDIGSQAHAVVEWTLKAALHQAVGPMPTVQDEALWAFMACEDWLKRHDVEPLLVEQVVYSRIHEYAGTLDLFCRLTTDEGRRIEAVIDFKTSKRVYDDAYLQNAAYQVALIEMNHGSPVDGYIVRLPKVTSDPAFEVRSVCAVAPVAQHFANFATAYDMWRYLQRTEERYHATKG